jgi:phosphate transport system substrate-binding protein
MTMATFSRTTRTSQSCSAVRNRWNISKTLSNGLFAVASLGVVLIVGCQGCHHYGEDGKPDEPKIVTTDVQSLGGAGSTFVDPLISRWSKDYGVLHKIQVNYRPIGSGGGIDELKRGFLTFAASDAALTDDQLSGMRPILQIPVTGGPVCVSYNVPNLSSPLKFSGKTLANIFSGEISNWNNSAIARENPGVKLPDRAIIVVHRSDGSGTTSIFTTYLSRVSAEWEAKAGHGLAVKWPAGIGVNGSKNVVATVKGTAGSIGYFELSYAKEAGLPVASIQNKAGEFVAPSPESASLAITAFNDALLKDLRTPVVDPPASAKGAYPISGLTYVLIPRNDNIPGVQRAFKDFITYAITKGQDSAEELSYSKLPEPIQQQSVSLLAQLTENDQPLK